VRLTAAGATEPRHAQARDNSGVGRFVAWLRILGVPATLLGAAFVVVTAVNGGPWVMPDGRDGHTDTATMNMTASLIWLAVGVVMLLVARRLSHGTGDRDEVDDPPS
jgi:cytochrome bd-type quinol oxidase subunit 2